MNYPQSAAVVLPRERDHFLVSFFITAMKGISSFAKAASVAAMILSLATPAFAASEPVVGAVSPLTATANSSRSLSASYADPDNVASCQLYVGGSSQGSMSLSGGTNSASGTASINHVFSAAGNYDVYVRCTDVNGNIGNSATSTVVVSASASPTVGGITPTSATVNASAILSASYSGSASVSSCSLYIDGLFSKAMALSGSMSGTASAGHTFTSTGSHTAQARCTDANGSTTAGAVTSIAVSASGSGDVSVPSMPTNLVWLTPGSNSTPSFSWSASSDNVGVTSYETSIDGASYVSVGSSLSSTTGVLANGTHSIAVRAKDAAGNVSSAASLSFVINTSVQPVPGASGLTLENMSADAAFVFGNRSRVEYEERNGRGCEMASSTASARLTAALGMVTNSVARAQIENFLACGTPTSLHLGAGERLGVVNSFRAAFGRLPSSSVDWFDTIKIGNGRFPGSANAAAEARARASFRQVYLRDANAAVTADNNAVTVMAYGLRPLPRNMQSEAAAIVTFRAVYGRMPSSAIDWDTVRAVAYSGATR